MPTHQHTFCITTKGHTDVLDITTQVEQAIAASGIRSGIVNVAGAGSTLAITTIEYEPGAVSDLTRALDAIAPANDDYAHNARWGDHNGYAHLRSALIGPSASYPVAGGKLRAGTWQQIVLCDFDDRPRRREITVTIVGE
jgi:secondary thiamine-phosphate synthase enzyme